MNRIRDQILTLYLLLTVLVLVGCGGDVQQSAHGGIGIEDDIPTLTGSDLSGGESLRVLATTNIVGEVVAQVGGDAISLTTLIPQGQDPHSYEASAQNAVAVEEAHVIFINGFGLEETLLDMVSANTNSPVVPVSVGINTRLSDDQADHTNESHQSNHDDSDQAVDPHVWFDPNNVIIWTENIADVLAEMDPENSLFYHSNADVYISELEALDSEIRSHVEQIPEQRRKLITDHAVFGYFAHEYQFEVIGSVIPGYSSTVNASASDLTELITLINTENVPAVFVGMSASQRTRQLAETLSEEADHPVQVLTLYTGSLDRAGEPGHTYIGMMRYNIEQISRGLGGL